MDAKRPEIGTILYHSIGCGYDEFYQVVGITKTKKSITVRRLDTKVSKRDKKTQTVYIVPIPNTFTETEVKTLRVAPDGQIGPIKRLIWWGIWEGKALHQYSD